MSIQKELREWADMTAKGYVSIAKEKGNTAPSFYTQSDLTKVLDTPVVMIIGINPGSAGDYVSQINNPNWELNGNDMDGDHLILGNYCKNTINWQKRRKWPFWNRLYKYFANVKNGNPLDDESKIVVTNMTFFNSKEAKDINNFLFYKSIPFTLDLIGILKPKQIVFLGGSGILNKLNGFNRKNHLFNMSYEMIKPRVFKGQFNNISFLAVPHPSAHLKREERQTVVNCITEFMD